MIEKGHTQAFCKCPGSVSLLPCVMPGANELKMNPPGVGMTDVQACLQRTASLPAHFTRRSDLSISSTFPCPCHQDTFTSQATSTMLPEAR